MPISYHFRDCKALLVTRLTHVSGAITSVQTFYYQFLQVHRVDQALILLGLAPCLPSTSVSSIFMVYLTVSSAWWDWSLTWLINHCPVLFLDIAWGVPPPNHRPKLSQTISNSIGLFVCSSTQLVQF